VSDARPVPDLDLAWDPVALEDLSQLVRGAPFRWWVAGGWAIDLHLGRTTRPHDDVDVVVLRPDQLAVQDHLAGWDLHAADPPGTLRPWTRGAWLPADVHDVWCRPSPGSTWSLQLMLDDVDVDVDGADWTYRRDPRVRRSVKSLAGPASAPDLPVLAPEVQLLCKSRAPRAKDEADLRSVLGALSPEQRRWLDDALAVTDPGNGWRGSVSRPT
jgi:hypothetical protein